jgi:hypothetical protein
MGRCALGLRGQDGHQSREETPGWEEPGNPRENLGEVDKWVQRAVQGAHGKSYVSKSQLWKLVSKILENKTHPEIKDEERFVACIASLRDSEYGRVPATPQAASKFPSSHQSCGEGASSQLEPTCGKNNECPSATQPREPTELGGGEMEEGLWAVALRQACKYATNLAKKRLVVTPAPQTTAEASRSEYSRELEATRQALDELEAAGEPSLPEAQVRLNVMHKRLATIAALPLASWLLAAGDDEAIAAEPGGLPRIFRGS